jgi:hypothetical protein
MIDLLALEKHKVVQSYLQNKSQLVALLSGTQHNGVEFSSITLVTGPAILKTNQGQAQRLAIRRVPHTFLI